MRRWLIRIVISLVVLGVGVVGFLAQLDVNQYKSEILDYIASQTGQTLSVDGDIGFKLALKPTLLVNGIAFGNAKWAAHESMVTADRVEVQLRGSGGSLAAIADSADGNISWVTRNAVIGHGAANIIGGDLLVGLASQLNPLGLTDPTTQIECFVIRFPITDGVAHNDTGIGARTTGLTMLGGGTIDLTTERIDLGIKPKPRTGVGLNLTLLADFVRLGGTLQQSEIVTDAAGAATAGLKAGAAVATVGLPVLAEGIFDRLTADTDVCAVALGKVPISDSNSKPSMFKRAPDKTKNGLEDAGESVKGMLKRIFGN